MRIVVTGGWGYGNLGDDAILNSTIENLKSVYPDCTIDVLTYDVDDSNIHKTNSVNIYKSVHGYADLNSCGLLFKKLEKDYTFFRKVSLKMKQYLVTSTFWGSIENNDRVGKPAIDIIRGADLLIMAGGGYFNEKWIVNVIAHLAEIKAAIRFGVPFCVTGPTIGTFVDPEIKKLIMDAFREAKSIYVRDEFSLKQFEREGIKAEIIPDIVLSKWKGKSTISPQKEKKTIGLILTNKDQLLRNKVANSLKSFLSDTDGEIKILMSRRWKQDYINSLAVQKELEALGLNNKIVIPGSFYSLEDSLAECDIVISENLHGLILATRNGVPIVAINDYSNGSPNYKKFVSFMSQVEMQKYVINSQTNTDDIIKMIYDSYSSKDAFYGKAEVLCNSVKNKTESFLKRKLELNN